MAQTPSSLSSSQQKSSSSGATVVSSTPISGTISSSGAFPAKSKATFYSATDGYLRVRYTLNGRFSGSASWSGKYTMETYSDNYGIACAFETDFTGSSIY